MSQKRLPKDKRVTKMALKRRHWDQKGHQNVSQGSSGTPLGRQRSKITKKRKKKEKTNENENDKENEREKKKTRRENKKQTKTKMITTTNE